MKNIINVLKYASGLLIAAMIIAGKTHTASAQDVHTFTNSSQIQVRDLTTANPYPSGIVVSGVPANATRVIVKLKGFTHSYPDDVGVIVVAPNGQKVRIFTDCLGDGAGDGVANLDLTFDDYAPAALPDNPLSDTPSGTYKPKRGTSDGASPEHSANFPPPAPGGPYAETLTSLDNINANGTWQLFVDDDGKGDSGTIQNGWELSFQTFAPTAAPAIISGNVFIPGVSNGFLGGTARVTMIDARGLETIVYTDASGRYEFPTVPSGERYTLSVFAKGRTFNPDTQILDLNEDTTINWSGI